MMTPVIIKSILVLNFFPIVFPSESRIESIEQISIEKAPYVVIVLCNNSKYFCTGSIVHKEWILTSAHCMFDTAGRYTEGNTTVFVVAGSDGLNQAEADIKSGRAQIRQSKQLVGHDEYTFKENFIHDLILIELQKPLVITKRVQKAPIGPERKQKEHNISIEIHGLPLFWCEVYGYGKVFLNEMHKFDYSLKLQRSNVGKYCYCLSRMWNLRSRSNVLNENTFICEEQTTLGGFCSGDQGSPLICENFFRGLGTARFHYTDLERCKSRKDGENECGDLKTLYVFTDLCYYSPWLNYYIPGYPLLDKACEANSLEQYDLAY